MAREVAAKEQRLDEAESRVAIAELVHRYARFIRHDEPEGVSTLFTHDGTFEVRDGHPDRGIVKVPKSFFDPLPAGELDAWEGRG